MLQNLQAVDAVRFFDSAEELEEICRAYQPDIMVKGSDYKDKPIVGSQYCKEIKFVDLVNGYSTTNTIKNIINR
jgi:D-beta-D-heptose 7-phosphate kinase/D-beta-D-heptose 1-phosphate adenosyltransferase